MCHVCHETTQRQGLRNHLKIKDGYAHLRRPYMAYIPKMHIYGYMYYIISIVQYFLNPAANSIFE